MSYRFLFDPKANKILEVSDEGNYSLQQRARLLLSDDVQEIFVCEVNSIVKRVVEITSEIDSYPSIPANTIAPAPVADEATP